MPIFAFRSLVASAMLVVVAPSLAAQQIVSTVTAPDVTMGLIRDPALAAAIAEISATRIRETDSTLCPSERVTR